jgi:hypothetical protein
MSHDRKLVSGRCEYIPAPLGDNVGDRTTHGVR